MSTFQVKKRLTSALPRLVVERTVVEPGDGVDGVFDGLGDGDLHLFDGHDAVVDADDDAGKVGLGKNGDGHAEGQVNAGESEDDGEEEDGLSVASEPEGGPFHAMSRCVNRTGIGWGWRTLVFVSLFACGGFVLVVFVVGGCDLYLSAVFHCVGAGGDHLFADLQALGDLGLVVLRDAEFDFAVMCGAVGGDDHDLLLAGGVGHDGGSGHNEGILNGFDRYGDFHRCSGL